ncbi:MAG: hypothetical protein Q9160_000122 [Pyrenula sp. 1 TL-2023]
MELADEVVPEVGLTGAPGVFVVESGGHKLFEPQARSVGQQPPPKDAGHDLNPVEQTEAVVTVVDGAGLGLGRDELVEEGAELEERGGDDDEDGDEDEDDGDDGDGRPGTTTVVVDVVIIGGKGELEVLDGGGREETVGCTVTVAVEASIPCSFVSTVVKQLE